MTRPLMFGLHGPKGSGKSWTANLMVEAGGFHRDAFAAPVKELAYRIAPAPIRKLVDLFGWNRLKQYGPFRRYLQRVGKEGVRDVLGDDVLVDALRRRVNPLLEDDTPVVIDDVRLPNEADMVRSLGGVVVGIQPSDGPSRADSHSTEHPLDNVDVWITNDRSDRFTLLVVNLAVSGLVALD